MIVKVVDGKEFFKILKEDYEKAIKTPGFERLLKLMEFKLEHFKQLKNFDEIPYHDYSMKYVSNTLYRVYELAKQSPKSIEDVKKKVHKRADYDYEWKHFAEKINLLSDKDLLAVYSVARFYKIIETIRTMLDFYSSLYHREENSEIYIRYLIYEDSKGELIVPDFLFHRNSFTNLQETMEYIRKRIKSHQDEAVEQLIKQMGSKKIYTFDGIPSYADLFYFYGVESDTLKQIFPINGFFIPVSLMRFKDEKELLNFLIENTISPYIHYKVYSWNFSEAISLLNKKDLQFFKNIVINFFARENPDVFTKFSYEELKELGIPDIAIVIAGEKDDNFEGRRSYVLASLKAGKTHIKVESFEAFDEKLVLENIDRIYLGNVGNQQLFMDSIKTTEGKIAFLYKYAVRSDANLQFVVSSFTKLAEPALELDRKYKILLLNSIKKIPDRITRYNKRVNLLLKLLNSAKPIKENELSIDFIEKVLSSLPNSDKIAFLSAFEPKVLSSLMESNLLSEEEKVIVAKVLNRNNTGKKGRITL